MPSKRSRSNSTQYDNASSSTEDTSTTSNLLKIPSSTRFFLLIKNDKGKYRYIPNVQYSDDYLESGNFIINSNRIQVIEAADDDHNVAIGYFGDFVWYYVGKLKNPAIRVNLSVGKIDTKMFTQLRGKNNRDFESISCGLFGTKKIHAEVTEDLMPEMCLVCWLYDSTFQFALRPIYDDKTLMPLISDIMSFRGFIRQAFDMLQSMVGCIDDGWSKSGISIIPGKPIRYAYKGPFKPLSDHPYCCLSCCISYLFLFDRKKMRPRGRPRVKTKKPVVKKEIPISTVGFNLNNGVLTLKEDFVPPQIDFIDHEEDYYVNSYVLLLTNDLNDSFPEDTWVHAIIKYWHKKYRVLFTHLFESSPVLDEAVTNYFHKRINVDEFFTIVSNCKLSNYVRSRQWICRVKCKHIFVCKLPKPFPNDNIVTPKAEPSPKYTCYSCNEEIDHVAGITKCPISTKKFKNVAQIPYESYQIDRGPEYTMGASTDDVFNSSMLTPITSIFVTMRSLIPVYASKKFTWSSSYPLDQINTVREFVRFLQAHWNPSSETPAQEQANRGPCFWGLRCSRCYKCFHAKCIHPPNARIPPLSAIAFDKNLEPKPSLLYTEAHVMHVPFYHAESFSVNHLDMDKWICSDCSDCAYCGLSLKLEILPDPKNTNGTKPRVKRRRTRGDSLVKTGFRGMHPTNGTSTGWPVVRCVSCNFAAHGACCNPVVPMIHFLSFWRCDYCRRCLACGWQDKHYCDYTNWDSQFFFCRRCNFLIGQCHYCAVCYGVWYNEGDVPMSGTRHSSYLISTHGETVSRTWIQCGGCMLWLHISCDPIAARDYGETKDNQENPEHRLGTIVRSTTYRCPICRSENRQLRYYRIIELLFLMDKNNELRYKVLDSCTLYWRIVKVPINLSQIKHRLERVGYSSDEEFTKDLLLIPHNAKLISMPNSKLHRLACNFEKRCNGLFSRILSSDRPKRESEVSTILSPIMRIHSQRCSMEEIEEDNDIDEIIEQALESLDEYEITGSKDCSTLVDRIVLSLFNNDVSSIVGNITFRNNYKLGNVLDVSFSQVFCVQRKVSSRGFYQHIDIDVCYVCKSVDNQNGFIYCMCCGLAAHSGCIGYDKSSLSEDKLSFHCSNCSFCFYCGHSCNSSHPLDISNISDVSIAIRAGWIPPNTAKSLERAKIDGIGYLQHLAPPEYADILYDSNLLLESFGGPIKTLPCFKCLKTIHLNCIQKMLQTTHSTFLTSISDSMIASFTKAVKYRVWRKNLFNNTITYSCSNQRSVQKFFNNATPSAIEKARKEGKRFKNSHVFKRDVITFINGTGQFLCCERGDSDIPQGISINCTLCSKLYLIDENPEVKIRISKRYTQICDECISSGFTSVFQAGKNKENIKFDTLYRTRVIFLTYIGLYKLVHAIISVIISSDKFQSYMGTKSELNRSTLSKFTETTITNFICSEYFTGLIPEIVILASEILYGRVKNVYYEKGKKSSMQINKQYIVNMFPEGFNDDIVKFLLSLLSSMTADPTNKATQDVIPPLTRLVWVVYYQFIRFYKNFKSGTGISKSHSRALYTTVDRNHTKSAFTLLGYSYLKYVLRSQLAESSPLEELHPLIHLQLVCFLCKRGSVKCLGNLLQFHYNNEVKSIHSGCIAWSLKQDSLSRTWNPIYNSLITLQLPLEGVKFKVCAFSPSIFPVVDVLPSTLNMIVKSSIKSICNLCASVGASVGCYGECGMKYHLPCLLSSELPLYISGKTCWCLNCWRSTEALRFQQLELLYSMSPQDSIKEDFFLCEGLGGGAVDIVSRLSAQLIKLVPGQHIPVVMPSSILKRKKKIDIDDATHSIFVKNSDWGYLILDSISYKYRYPIGYKFYKRWWHREVKGKRCLYMFTTRLVGSDIEFRITDVGTNETFKNTRLTTLVQEFIKEFKENVSFISSLFAAEDMLQMLNFGETLFGFNDPECVRISQLKYLSALNKRISRLSTPSDLAKITVENNRDNMPVLISLEETRNNDDSRVRRKFDIVKTSMLYRYLQSVPPDRLRVSESAIHGLGLFSNQLIQTGEPIIEYIGELIRDVISDVREKIYTKRWGIDGSCYMFRLDEEFIVDATRMGNMARFINHSCEPNCVCKIITSETGTKHIVIFAKRDIIPGEEITYNYQFGIEAEANKLICHCGAPSCLKRMN